MPSARRVLPGRFYAGRDLTLEGTTYARGQEIPAAVVARTPRVSALVSRRWIVPDPDPQLRRTRPHVPAPVVFEADERARLAGSAPAKKAASAQQSASAGAFATASVSTSAAQAGASTSAVQAGVSTSAPAPSADVEVTAPEASTPVTSSPVTPAVPATPATPASPSRRKTS